MNPFKLENLTQLLGQQETQKLEFKSSRPMLDDNERNKFLRNQVVPTVSAFLNTDGGLLVIGVEEKEGVAAELSCGVLRSRYKQESLQLTICNRIQPAVAGYISVFSVQVGRSPEGDALFAFVVDVKPGTTAYHADDKIYYVRRSGQNEAMEDKDIRLRMLSGDKPRIVIELQPRVVNYCAEWNLLFENAGIRTIPCAIVRSKLSLQGLSNNGRHMVSCRTPEYKETTFPFEGLDQSGLLPGRRFELSLITVPSLAFECGLELATVTMMADVTVFIDDGLPAELKNYDLMADLRPIIESNWTIRPNDEDAMQSPTPDSGVP